MANRNEKISFSIFINDREAGKTISQLRQESRKLSNEINKNLIPGTKEYKEAVKKLRGLNSSIAEHRKKVRGISGAWSSIKKEIRSFVAIALTALGARELLQGIDNLIQRNAALDDSYRDVAKTTGLTVVEVQKLTKELKKIDTRTPTKDLIALAEVAGKLGKTGEKEIAGFVRAADKINVALGKDLGGNIENTIRQLGKISQLFGVEDTFGTEDGLIKIGSAINALGAGSTANEEFLVEFTKRLGGVAAQAGLSVDEILGLAATLDQLGQTSETSTTALSQLLVKMGKEVETFAEIAGVSTEVFSKLLKEDANAALLAVLEGSKSAKGGVEGLAVTLDRLGIDGSRAAGVLGALSSNTKLLKEQQALSAKEFQKGTSIINEFNTKNEGLAANLDKIRKALNDKFVNSGLVNAFERIVSAGSKYLSIPLTSKLESERKSFSVLVTQIELAGDNQERRNALIQELQKQYPQYLANVDAETVTNQDLRDVLQQVNKEYVAKIILAKKQEEIKKIADKEAKAVERLANQYLAVSKYIDNIVENTGFERLIGESADDFAKRFVQTFESGSAEYYAAYNDLLKLGTLRAGDYIEEQNNLVDGIRSELEKAKEEAILFEDQLNKILGIEDKKIEIEVETKETTKTSDGGSVNDDRIEKDKAAREAADKAAEEKAEREAAELERQEKALAQLNETIAKYSRENELAKLESDERELAQITDKYQKLIDQAEEYDRDIKDIEALRDQELTAKRLEFQERDLLAYEEFTQRFTELQRAFNLEKAEIDENETAIDELNQEFELEQLSERYSLMLEKLYEFQDAQVISAEETEAEIARIKQFYSDEKELIEERYRKKKEQDDQKDFDKQIALEEKKRKARFKIAQSVQSGLASILDIVGNDAAAFAEFQKVLALFQIGIDTGKAISAATAAAAGEPFPANIAAIVTSIAAVLSGIAQAKRALTTAGPVPQYAEGGFTLMDNQSSTPMPSFKGGGLLKSPTLALAGEAGPEYIVPNWQLRQPKYANLVRVLEAGRRAKAYAEGGITSDDFEAATSTEEDNFEEEAITTTGVNDQVMIQFLPVLTRLDAKLDQPLIATINNNTLEENKKRLNEIDPEL